MNTHFGILYLILGIFTVIYFLEDIKMAISVFQREEFDIPSEMVLFIASTILVLIWPLLLIKSRN